VVVRGSIVSAELVTPAVLLLACRVLFAWGLAPLERCLSSSLAETVSDSTPCRACANDYHISGSTYHGPPHGIEVLPMVMYVTSIACCQQQSGAGIVAMIVR